MGDLNSRFRLERAVSLTGLDERDTGNARRDSNPLMLAVKTRGLDHFVFGHTFKTGQSFLPDTSSRAPSGASGPLPLRFGPQQR